MRLIPSDLVGLLWTANEMMHVKPWSQSGTHSKGPVNVGYHDDDDHLQCHQFPCSYGQGHLAFASTLMAQKVSFLLRLGPKYRVRPLLSLCHFAGPGVSGDPEGKGDKVSYKAKTQSWSPSIDITRAQWSSWRRASRTHIGKGLGNEPLRA